MPSGAVLPIANLSELNFRTFLPRLKVIQYKTMGKRVFEQYKALIQDDITIALASHGGVDSAILVDLTKLTGYHWEDIAFLFNTSV